MVGCRSVASPQDSRTPLGLELPERLADRDMAGLKLLGDMVLHQPRTGGERAADDPLCERRRRANHVSVCVHMHFVKPNASC